MDAAILTVFLGVAGMIAGFYWVMKPLWQSARHDWRASTIWSDWLDRKRTLLFNLEDLALEQKLGKISAEDYARLEATYKKELLALVDQMQSSAPPVEFEEFMTDFAEGAQLSALPSRTAGAKACFSCKAFYEGAFAFCPKCGKPLTAAK